MPPSIRLCCLQATARSTPFSVPWGHGGSFLILPGGTMTLLAKALHDTLDPVAIIKAALSVRRLVSLPIVKAGQHRAYVGASIGPGAKWIHAREAIRKWRLARVWRAARFAWRRTFGTGIRIRGVPELQSRYQAVFIHIPVAVDEPPLRMGYLACRRGAAFLQRDGGMARFPHHSERRRPLDGRKSQDLDRRKRSIARPDLSRG